MYLFEFIHWANNKKIQYFAKMKLQFSALALKSINWVQ